MDTPTPEPAAAQPFEHLEQVGQVELDRYCVGCGYNLRQQPVRRETTTRLLLCKCPECGAFEPANQATTRQRSWFAQLVLVLWLIWIAVLGGALIGAISVTADLAVQASETLTMTQDLAEPIEVTTPAGHRRKVSFEYALRPLNGEHGLELALRFIAAFAIAAGLITLAMLFVPHWPRRSYVILAFAWPLVALVGGYVILALENDTLEYATRGLTRWIYLSPLVVVLCTFAGGLTAVCLARPIARLVVRMLIPEKQRGPFAYLWLVDSKATN